MDAADIEALIGTYMWETPPASESNVFWWTEVVDYYARPRKFKKSNGVKLSSKSCFGDEESDYLDLDDENCTSSDDGNRTSSDDGNRTSSDEGPNRLGDKPFGSDDGNSTSSDDGNSTSSDEGKPRPEPSRKPDVGDMGFKDLATFYYDYSFFDGDGREPTLEEMESMICETAYYFDDEWNSTGGIIDKFDFLVSDWTYASDADWPLSLTFQVRAKDEDDHFLKPGEVLTEMTVIDVAHYLKEYVQQTPPVSKNNVFKHTERAKYHGTIEPNFGADAVIFTSKSCPRFAVDEEDSLDDGNSTTPEGNMTEVTITTTFLISTPKGTPLNESDIDAAFGALVEGIAQVVSGGAAGGSGGGAAGRFLRGRRTQVETTGVVDTETASLDSITPIECPEQPSADNLDCYQGAASYQVSVPAGSDPEVVSDTFTEATEAYIESGGLNSELKAINPDSSAVITADPSSPISTVTTPPVNDLIEDEGVTEGEGGEEEKKDGGLSPAATAILIVVVVLLFLMNVGLGLYYCYKDKLLFFADREDSGSQADEVRNKSIRSQDFDDEILGTEVLTDGGDHQETIDDDVDAMAEEARVGGEEVDQEEPVEEAEVQPDDVAEDEVKDGEPDTMERDATPSGTDEAVPDEAPAATEEAVAEQGDEAPAETEDAVAEQSDEELAATEETVAEGDEAPAATEEAAEGDELPATDEGAETEKVDEAPAADEEAETENGEETPAATEEAVADEGDEAPATDEGAETEKSDEAPAADEGAVKEEGDEAPAATEEAVAEGDEAPAATEEEATTQEGKPTEATSESETK